MRRIATPSYRGEIPLRLSIFPLRALRFSRRLTVIWPLIRANRKGCEEPFMPKSKTIHPFDSLLKDVISKGKRGTDSWYTSAEALEKLMKKGIQISEKDTLRLGAWLTSREFLKK